MVLLVTVSSSAVASLQTDARMGLFAVVGAALVAGVLTALYVRQRGGMHALIGGMSSVPLLALFILPGNWQLALFAGAFCTLGGTLTEIVLRRRTAA